MTLTPVVKRTLLLLGLATLLVLLAVAAGLPGQGAETAAGEGSNTVLHAADADHGATDDHAVASELEFIAGMVPHHQEAVDSATALLALSERPEIRALAEDVVRAQTAEIERLQGWLAAFYSEAPAYQGYVSMMRSADGMSAEEAEVAFMEDMIVHHQMALAMAEAYLALEAPRRAEVEALARDVVSTQSTEIESMQAWLAAHSAGQHQGH